MTSACLYSIIRFRPFIETGEFANIGIVAADTVHGGVSYRLVPRRVRRISQFFTDIHPGLLAAAVSFLSDELERIRLLAKGQTPREGTRLLGNLIRPRESAVVFGDPRTTMVNGNLDDTVDKLFDRYVRRAFASTEYREAVLTREIKSFFRTRQIRGYGRVTIDDDIVPMTFEIGSRSNGLRVVRPLAFAHKSTLGIIDHGAQWAARFRHLIDRDHLRGDHVLLPIDTRLDPAEPHAPEARDEAVEGLKRLGLQVIGATDFRALADFALPGASRDITTHH